MSRLRTLLAALNVAGLVGALGVQTSAQTTGISAGTHGVASPLIARGYTDAPNGIVVVHGDPNGGNVVSKLLVSVGDEVVRGQAIAIMGNHVATDIAVQQHEAALAKALSRRAAMISGFRQSEIKAQLAAVELAKNEKQLKALELARSQLPTDQREMQLAVAERGVERATALLKLKQTTLHADIQRIDADIEIQRQVIESAKIDREFAIVRAPIDGVVADIFARQGEMIKSRGIAKLVDWSELRVLADVDEFFILELQAGRKVELVFRGSEVTYSGTIVRAPVTVKRTKRSEADLGLSSVRLVEVEMKFDPTLVPPRMLGREVRVVFK